MKPILRFAFCICVLLSFQNCKKDDVNNPGSVYSASDYMPIKTGNYWVYDLYLIRANGTDSLIRTDSSYIAYDTLITGKKYYKWVSPMNFGPFVLPNLFVRDSADYIVGPNGLKVLALNNYTDTLSRYLLGDTVALGIFKMGDKDKNIAVPAGTFTTISRVGIHTLFAPYDAFGKTRNSFTRFTPKVGVVLDRTFDLYSDYTIERRLVRYKVN